MMHNKIFLLSAALSLTACSLIERTPETDQENQLSAGLATANADSPALSNDLVEKELSRMNAKIEALETKVEVLTNNLEKQQLKSAQPAISAEPNPVMSSNAVAQGNMEPIHAAKGEASLSGEEGQFRNAMELFQNGKNLEAGVAFLNFAKAKPKHHLAPHALYWGGEANGRAEQWRLAVSSWESLQLNYPRSAYLPEALAGLVRGYNALGDGGKAQMARAALLNSFPQAPAALSLQSTSPAAATPAAAHGQSEADGAEMVPVGGSVDKVDEDGITPQEETN